MIYGKLKRLNILFLLSFILASELQVGAAESTRKRGRGAKKSPSEHGKKSRRDPESELSEKTTTFKD